MFGGGKKRELNVHKHIDDIKKGYLMKCSKNSGANWKKRYFVLSGNTLNYYKNNRDLDIPKGNVLIVEDGIVKMENQIKTKASGGGKDYTYYGFRFTTPFDSILFMTISSEDRAAWMRALESAVALSRTFLRGYILNVVHGITSQSKVRKFFVLHSDVLTYHKDHESTKETQFKLQIDEKCAIVVDDAKWSIKVDDLAGKRLVKLQFEERTKDQYPQWRDAMLRAKNRVLEQRQAQAEATAEAMEYAVQKGDLKVRTADGTAWEEKLVAFTETRIVVTGLAEGDLGRFYDLTPSTVVEACDPAEVGDQFAFQVSTADSILYMAASSEAERDEWINSIVELIPQVQADSADILLRAAIAQIGQDEFYDVEITDKKAHGIVFTPHGNWGVIKDHPAHDTDKTGIYPGSILTAVNGENVMFYDWKDSATLLKNGCDSPDTLKLTFRKAPYKRGMLNKRSAGRKGQAATWVPREFELKNGKLSILPPEGVEGFPPIDIPLQDATVSLVPFSKYMKEYCFCIQVGMVPIVLQGESLEDCIDWAALISHAAALAQGGGHIMDFEQAKEDRKAFIAELLQQVPEDILANENHVAYITAIQTAIATCNSEDMKLALDAAYHAGMGDNELFQPYLEYCGQIINEFLNEEQLRADDYIALQSIIAPDQAQMAAFDEENAAAYDGFEGAMAGDDSDEEGHARGSDSIDVRDSLINVDFAHASIALEQTLTAEESAEMGIDDNELRQMKALADVSGSNDEVVEDPANEEDLRKLFSFYCKEAEDNGELFISVMSFCTIYRMVAPNKKGDLRAQMQAYNE